MSFIVGVQITTVPISKVSSLCSHHLKKPSNPIAILDTSEKNGDYKIICDNIFKSSDTTAVVNLSEKKRYPKVLCDDILKSPCPTANLDASEKKEEPKILSENISELSSLTTNVSAEECKSNITEKTGVRNGNVCMFSTYTLFIRNLGRASVLKVS